MYVLWRKKNGNKIQRREEKRREEEGSEEEASEYVFKKAEEEEKFIKEEKEREEEVTRDCTERGGYAQALVGRRFPWWPGKLWSTLLRLCGVHLRGWSPLAPPCDFPPPLPPPPLSF